jgi:hypothetical protein
MARNCKHYKAASCSGDRTCRNASMTATKFCPFVKSGKFLKEKAACTCKGYAATECGRPSSSSCRKTIAGRYYPGKTVAGKYYIRLTKDLDLVIVDHCGHTVGAGFIAKFNLTTGKLMRYCNTNRDYGLCLDDGGSIQVGKL